MSLLLRRQTVAYALAALAGGMLVAGSSARLQAHRRVIAAQGSVRVTGSVARLRAGRKVSAVLGGIRVNGVGAGLRSGRKISAVLGSEKINGSAARLRTGRVIGSGFGAGRINGASANLVYTPAAVVYELTASPGTHKIGGSASSFRSGRAAVAGVGSCRVVGSAASLRAGRVLETYGDGPTVLGAIANLVYTEGGAYGLWATPGGFVLTGAAANLKYAGIPEPVAHNWGTPNQGRLIASFPRAKYALAVAPGVGGAMRGAPAGLVIRRSENEEALLLAMLD